MHARPEGGAAPAEFLGRHLCCFFGLVYELGGKPEQQDALDQLQGRDEHKARQGWKEREMSQYFIGVGHQDRLMLTWWLSPSTGQLHTAPFVEFLESKKCSH